MKPVIPPSFARCTRTTHPRESEKSQNQPDPSSPHLCRSQTCAATPSFAQPTKASRSRESRTKSAKLKSPLTTPGSGHHLENQQNWIIKPADPTKSCKFGSLPTEVRQMIYEYVLDFQAITVRTQRSSRSTFGPALLRVCRRVRRETAYLFYSRTGFTFIVDHLDFSDIKKWVLGLPVLHRRFLARNRNLHIQLCEVHGDTRYMIYWTQAVESYRPFFNPYAIPTGRHKHQFIAFCRLSSWFLWCAQPIYRDMKWSYSYRDNRWTGYIYTYSILHSIEYDLGAFNFPCVRHVTVDDKQKSIIKKAALNMLEDVEDYYVTACNFQGKGCPGQSAWEKRDADQRFGDVRRFLEKW